MSVAFIHMFSSVVQLFSIQSVAKWTIYCWTVFKKTFYLRHVHPRHISQDYFIIWYLHVLMACTAKSIRDFTTYDFMNMECYDDNGNMCGFFLRIGGFPAWSTSYFSFTWEKLDPVQTILHFLVSCPSTRWNQLSQTFFDSKTDDATIAIILQIPVKQVSNFILHTHIMSN